MNRLSRSLEDTKKIAEDFISGIPSAQSNGKSALLVALYGDLGSGKTTFTQQVAKVLGVAETVTSPTFVIEKIYDISHGGFTQLIHIDAYRLESSKELLNLNWKEIIENPKNIIMLEWPERVADILPPNIKKIHFTFIDEATREIGLE